jgi:ATP-dependent protease ClpP protease subunit
MPKPASATRPTPRTLVPPAIAAGETDGFDDDYGYSWEPLKPYLDGDTLVIPVMDVIADSFWGSCLSAKMVQRALLKNKSATRIKLIVNCPGGHVSEGTAIYTLLRADGRPIEAHVIGLAASMATVIILAADTRVLHTGCMLMVHEPSLSWTAGNRHQLRSDATRLDVTLASMLDIYEERTGTSRDELAAMLEDETWLSAEDGRRIGFGTEVVQPAAEPMMSVLRADEAWNARRGAALALYGELPPEVQQGTALGWDGPSLAELRAANALADAHNFPTLTMALEGVRRSVAVAQPKHREATPPPRPVQPQPAASSRTTPMDEETLRELGLSPGATNEQIAAAFKAKAAEAKAKVAAAEAKAQEAELQAKLAVEQRAREERAAAEAKVRADKDAAEAKALADHTVAVTTFLADITDGVKADLEAMAFTEELQPDGSKKRTPNPDGFARAQRLAASNPAARKSSLAGPSAQAQAARQAAASNPPPGASGAPVSTGPVMYRFAGSQMPINLSKVARVTPQQVAARQAEMKARAEAKQQFGT